MSFNELEQYLLKNNLIIKKCGERGCKLKDIKSSEFMIINGDLLESINKSSQLNNSVDCIIIKKKKTDNFDFDIILCELTSDDKKITTLKNKFINSAKRIYGLFKHYHIDISSIKCIFIGKINTYHRSTRTINRNLYLQDINIAGEKNNNVLFEYYPCGHSIKNI